MSISRKGRLSLVGVGIALLLPASLVVCLSPFSYASVCSKCGAIKHTTEWQFRRTSIGIFSQSSTQETPLSLALSSSGIVKNHSHEWLFSQGGGNGVRCALGEGHAIRGSVESEGLAQVLLATERFGEVQFRDRLLQMVFDAQSSEMARGVGITVPTNVLLQAQSFREWMIEEIKVLDWQAEWVRK